MVRMGRLKEPGCGDDRVCCRCSEGPSLAIEMLNREVHKSQVHAQSTLSFGSGRAGRHQTRRPTAIPDRSSPGPRASPGPGQVGLSGHPALVGLENEQRRNVDLGLLDLHGCPPPFKRLGRAEPLPATGLAGQRLSRASPRREGALRLLGGHSERPYARCSAIAKRLASCSPKSRKMLRIP